MAEATVAQEAVAWITGLVAAGGTIAFSWSKLARTWTADRNAATNEQSSQMLYDLLVKENTRMAERNQLLETKGDLMLARLHELEVVHVKLAASESENLSLKAMLQRKDEQLSAILTQQQSDRRDWDLQLQESNRTIMALKSRVEHFERIMTPTPVPADMQRRAEDVPPVPPLNFQ